MLCCCEDFALSYGLRFNATKTQLIRFSTSPSSPCSAQFKFIFACGQQLPFLDTVSHLGHLLYYNLCDVPDVCQKLHDIVKKANCVITSFPGVGPFILTRLFQAYYLSLHGSDLWILSCTALQNLDVAFIKILRRIWPLPN